jgi:hypothetical protein
MWRFLLFYCELNNFEVNGGRKVTCAVHAAHWLYLEYILSTIFLWQQVRLVEFWRTWDRREDSIIVILRKNDFGVYSSGLRWHP